MSLDPSGNQSIYEGRGLLMVMIETPTHPDEEILADLETKAAHWELEATLNSDAPDIAAVCPDYAKHLLNDG